MELVAILQAVWLTGICAARDCEKLFFFLSACITDALTYIYPWENQISLETKAYNVSWTEQIFVNVIALTFHIRCISVATLLGSPIKLQRWRYFIHVKKANNNYENRHNTLYFLYILNYKKLLDFFFEFTITM